MKRFLLPLVFASFVARAADGPRADYSVRSVAELVAIDPRSVASTNSSGDWLLNVYVRANGARYSVTNLGTAWTGTNTTTLLKGVAGLTSQRFAWRQTGLSMTDLRSTNNILAWASCEAYQPNGTIIRNPAGLITAMPIKWPDGALGDFTGTANANGFGLDSYQLTYINGGVTNLINQYTVSRDSAGNVTSKPLLNFQ